MTETSARAGMGRRQLLELAGAAVLLTAPAACSPQPRGGSGTGGSEDGSDGPGGGGGTARRRPNGREAPGLRSLVRAGKLPPVRDRLPDHPVVVGTAAEVGAYGGTWSRVIPTPDTGLDNVIGYTALVRWDQQWKKIVPDVVESYRIGGDGSEFDFRLRKGLKWSDGEPFTADDIVFAMEDVFLNPELFPAPSTRLIAGGEPGHAEKVDTHTVRFRFAAPNGQFLMSLAGLHLAFVTNPFHYMKQFHKKYNPGIADLVSEAGVSDWTELYFSKGGDFGRSEAYWQNVDMPTLNPWRITTASGDGTRAVAERNPYYWKVDAAGSQLPYIDRVVFTLANSPDVMVLKAQNGEIGMQADFFTTLENKPVLARNRGPGGYRFFDLSEANMNTMLIGLNLTHNDRAKRAVFQNKDFRIGLSYALNRREIIDVVFAGKGRPWQAAPRPESPLYDERLATQYTGHSIEQANRYLDRAGYTERGPGGIRLGPDGKPIAFRLSFPTTYPPNADVAQLVKGYWKAVGVDAEPKAESDALFEERIDAELADVVLDNYGEGLLYDVLLEPNAYFPFGSSSWYAYAWGKWAVGSGGERPPRAARRQLALYNEAMSTTDLRRQVELMRQILRIAQQEFYQLGVMLPTRGYAYGIVRNDFHNVPATMISSAEYAEPGPTYPERYFIA